MKAFEQLLRRKGSILVLDDLHLLTESEERRQFCSILEQILAAYPATQQAPEVLYDLGYTYEQLGKNAQAEETYKRLIINYPTDKYASRAQSRLSRLEK